MNKITKQHYPAAKLPDDLRVGIDPKGSVTVTVVEEETEQRQPLSRDELRTLLQAAQREAKEGSIDDAVARVRALRDEWDD